MKKRNLMIALLLAVLLTFSACARGTGSTASSVGADGSAAVTVNEADYFSDRDRSGAWDESKAVSITLNGNSAACDGSGVEIDGSVVTITAEGVYVLSGTLDDGCIVVNATKDEKVQLVLDGVTITSSGFAPIYVKQADKVFVTLADGSLNTLTNGGSFTAIDENDVDAVIFSKDDLTLNGTGSLIVNSPAGHGVVGKDEVTITGGSYEITAAKTAISANDVLAVADGAFQLTAGTNGMRAKNDDASLGNIYLAGGSFKVTADGDCVSATGTLTVAGGSFTVISGASGSDSSASQKGLKSGGALTVSDGTIWVVSTDDAIHSDSSVTIANGTLNLSSGDDGIHADETVTISGGSIVINKSYEGIEGLVIRISGGEIDLTASDDGLNAGGGADSSGFGGREGDRFGENSSASLEISGGVLRVNADGDGLDSNGSFTLSGGEVYVSGPTNDDNGALDYSSGTVTGGSLVATGSGGMALNFNSATQGAILLSVGTQAAGSTVTLTDESGSVILTYTAEKAFNAVNLTSPALLQGGTYTVTAGTYSETVTLSELLYGSAAGMGGRGGFGGNMGGGRGHP